MDIEGEDGDEATWRIWGEDEVMVEEGILSWRSPLARALVGKRPGDAVSFVTPKGRRTVEVLEVRYEAQEPVPDDYFKVP